MIKFFQSNKKDTLFDELYSSEKSKERDNTRWKKERMLLFAMRNTHMI